MRFGAIFYTLLVAVPLFTTGTNSAPQPAQSYLELIPVFWSELYPQGGETLYCGTRFAAAKGASINIEHVLPMGWVMNEMHCTSRDQCRADHPAFNRVESDLHNLYPARKEINKARSSMAFGVIRGERRKYGDCDFEIDHRTRRVEPRPAARGEIARALLYMHETYAIPIYPRQRALLKVWNRSDPPSTEERLRNGRIEQLQGTRNRFIDTPEAAEGLRF